MMTRGLPQFAVPHDATKPVAIPRYAVPLNGGAAPASEYPFRARMGGSFRNPTGGIRRR
jgi:hypothetical protein